jgi:large subunit ribosomal protein L3
MAGHHGHSRVTQLNVKVERIDADKNLIYVRGAVPGHPNAFVRIRPTVKG